MVKETSINFNGTLSVSFQYFVLMQYGNVCSKKLALGKDIIDLERVYIHFVVGYLHVMDYTRGVVA